MLGVFFCRGGNQGLTVVIQGQGQTTGQLQLIPQGVTILRVQDSSWCKLQCQMVPFSDSSSPRWQPQLPPPAPPPPSLLQQQVELGGCRKCCSLVSQVAGWPRRQEDWGFPWADVPQAEERPQLTGQPHKGSTDLLLGQTPCCHPSPPLGNEESRGSTVVNAMATVPPPALPEP